MLLLKIVNTESQGGAKVCGQYLNLTNFKAISNIKNKELQSSKIENLVLVL